MEKWILWLVISCFSFFGKGAVAQITISMASLQSVNVTPSEMCRITLINQGQAKSIIMEAEIRNSSNDLVLFIRTSPYYVEEGVTTINPHEISFLEVNYGVSQQAAYVQARRQLPSGNYSYCVRVSESNDNGNGDSFCDEISNLNYANMMLVNPENKEVIETKNPMLIWMHSEPFDVLSTGEVFKLILVELTDEQSAQSGISVNPPLFFVNQVLSHNIFYSFDAPELVPGNRYGWQIQRIANGVIIDRTEAWEFSLITPKVTTEVRYVKLKKELDSGFYTVQNEKIFFRFDEKYHSNSAKCTLYNSQNMPVVLDSENEVYQGAVNYKANGYNTFEVDLEALHLKSGFYVLEVKNEKNESFQLKFYME